MEHKRDEASALEDHHYGSRRSQAAMKAARSRRQAQAKRARTSLLPLKTPGCPGQSAWGPDPRNDPTGRGSVGRVVNAIGFGFRPRATRGRGRPARRIARHKNRAGVLRSAGREPANA